MTPVETLDELQVASEVLIRDEIRAGSSRLQLEQAVVKAIRGGRVSIDDASAVTGLTPRDIRLAQGREAQTEGELEALAGIV